MKLIKHTSPAKPKFGAVVGDNALATVKDVNQVINEINLFNANQTIAATGITQTGAAALIIGINIVSTTVGNTAVVLPCLGVCNCDPCACCIKNSEVPESVAPIIVKNTGTESLLIYPCRNVSIDNMAINTPLVLEAGSSISFNKIDCSNVVSYGCCLTSDDNVVIGITGCNVDNTDSQNPVIIPLATAVVSPTEALTGNGCNNPLEPLSVCIDGVTITKDGNGCLQALGVGGVQSLTGCNVDNTDPANPMILDIEVDEVTITGTGCVGDPLIAIRQGVCTDATLTGDGTIGNCLSVVASPVTLGYAEYVQHSQSTNASIAPGSAIEYLTDNPAGVFNTLGITTTTGPGGQGTEFLLPVGVYMIDFENSSDAAWSLAIYKSLVTQLEVIDTNTIAGASTATTWIHGRAIISAAAPTYIIISPVTGTQAIPTAGTAAGEFIARLTILKIA